MENTHGVPPSGGLFLFIVKFQAWSTAHGVPPLGGLSWFIVEFRLKAELHA